jgi:hypothetical protein
MVFSGGNKLMHIPPYYKRRGFQYFFVGILVGIILSYLFFLYIEGQLTERWIEQNVSLRKDVVNLQNQINELLKDRENLSKEKEKKLTVQDINVTISNAEQLKLDKFFIYELTSQIKNELIELIGNSVDSLAENRTLIRSTIENKVIKIDKFTYRSDLTELIIAPPNLYITVKLKAE